MTMLEEEVLNAKIKKMSNRDLAMGMFNARCALNAQFETCGQGSDYLAEYELLLLMESGRRFVEFFNN